MSWQYDEDIQSYIKIANDIGGEIPNEALPPKMPNYILKVLDFYNTISTQWIVGFNGRVGLNYQSVESMARIFDFELTAFNMSVIQEIEFFILSKDREKDG